MHGILKSAGFLLGTCCSLWLGGESTASTVDDPYVVRFARSAIVLDGEPDDVAWSKAVVLDTFAQPWLPDSAASSNPVTSARLLWDREYLYLLVEMDDDQLVSEAPADQLGLYLKPTEMATGYYEFQLAPHGPLAARFFSDRNQVAPVSDATKSRRMFWQAAVKPRGKKDGERNQAGWTVEARIPWTDLLATGGRPQADEVWRFALWRQDHTPGLARPLVTTSNQRSSKANPDRHEHADYRACRFERPVTEGLRDFLGLHQGDPRIQSKLIGSPDPPLPFTAERKYTDLKLRWPICVANVPGSKRLLIIDEESPYGRTRLVCTGDDPATDGVDVLLDLQDVAYSLCFDPEFAENGYFYLGSNGARAGGPIMSRVTRYQLDRDPHFGLVANSATVIIEWESNGHNGAAVGFGLDGMLYVTSGDGTSDSDKNLVGQGLDHLLGKVLRIDVRHPAPGAQYAVPADNPFVDRANARPETWAYGLRNPWRLSVDPVLGHVWVGNNGQDLWEQVYRIDKGANYGWSVVEGSHPFYPNRQVGPDPIQEPTLEHPHSESRSLTGGVVYYGKRFPDLRGAYIYGDYSTGKIWAAKVDPQGTLLWHKPIADTALQITSFAIDHDGELLITDHQAAPQGGLYTLQRTEVAETTVAFPGSLSETGLFGDVAAHQLRPGVLPYSVNSPLWSDGSHKLRFVAIPPGPAKDEAATIGFREQGPWEFPEGTVLIKSFGLETIQGDPASRRWVETRFLVLQQGEWVGYSYAWNKEQTDAYLVEAGGRDESFSVQTAEGFAPQAWRFPSRTECMVCHSRAAGFVLGLSTQQLNRTHDYGDLRLNQIEVFEELGLLRTNWSGAIDQLLQRQLDPLPPETADDLEKIERRAEPNQRAISASNLLPLPADTQARLADPYDESQSLDERARSYLHANCAHCHVEAGGGNAQIDLASGTSLDNMRAVDVRPLHHTFDLPDARILAPGSPERSVLLHRVSIRERGQMPQLATFQRDERAVELLRRWIAQLPATKEPND